jgi:glucose-6-phosphate isomerase
MTDRTASWKSFRAMLIDDSQSGFRLDLSRMGISSAWLDTMRDPAAQALDAMEQLEGGAIANPDEERRVGHYWLRAPERAPEPAMTAQIVQAKDDVIGFAARVRSGEVAPPSADRFRQLLVIGIGGSALGPQFIADALGCTADGLQPHFIDNTDPEGIDRVLNAIVPSETLVVVISKSGGTAETRNGMLEASARFSATGLQFGRHAVAITQDGSKLDQYATEHAFLARFPMWDWVGGRTSVLSAVGLLPAALQGADVTALLEGAATMDQLNRVREIEHNPAMMLALAWYHAGDGRGTRDMVILPYKDRLALFSRYLQQLVMESIGKEKDLDGKVVRQGIAVYGNKGSTDQHAYVQQLRDGIANFFATFIQVQRDRPGASMEVEDGTTAGDYLHGFLLGTRRALFENERASITIRVRDGEAADIGRLIALYERAVGFYSSLVHVNAYHQPGVEAGKKAAAEVLQLQKSVLQAMEGKPATTAEALSAVLGANDPETVFHILEHLAANGRLRREPAADPCDATYVLPH